MRRPSMFVFLFVLVVLMALISQGRSQTPPASDACKAALRASLNHHRQAIDDLVKPDGATSGMSDCDLSKWSLEKKKQEVALQTQVYILCPPPPRGQPCGYDCMRKMIADAQADVDKQCKGKR